MQNIALGDLPKEAVLYYRLLDIDGHQLPAPALIAGRPVTVTEGGLLLTPPTLYANPSFPDSGHADVRFFGTPSPDGSGLLGASSEEYRWVGEHEIEVTRAYSTRGTRFRGRADGALLALAAVGEGGFLATATTLLFEAAPHLPIPARWRGGVSFAYSTLAVHRSEGSPAQGGTQQVEQFEADLEDLLRREAQIRLERAWHATA